jgi:periplasmic protein TonB
MMKPEHILSSDLLDILFDQRNKEYGAYELRREYHRRLWIALCSVPVMAGLFLWMNYLNKAFQTDLVSDLRSDSAVVKLIHLSPPEPEKPLVAPKQKQVATIKDTPPLIVPDQQKADPPPTVDELLNDNRAISSTTEEGPPPTTNTSPAAATPGGTGDAPAATQPAPGVEKIVTTAEVMPEFPGGVDALRRFLGRNLRVPENAMEPGQRIKVPVRFVVNKGGELSDVEFLVQVDEILKKEILRVMQKMPKWKSGSQNGRPVAVYFVIPIIFEVGE